MGNDECTPVSVSRRIDAPAGEIFKLLADPGRHPEIDGSGMLRPGASNEVVAGAGDVFVMKMFMSDRGDYEMHNRVVAYEVDRCIAWEPALPNVDAAEAEQSRNGSRWEFGLVADGPAATVVTETYDCSDSPEPVRQAVKNGNGWIEAMTTTLERLDQLCAGA
jgi:uncharacterized protein YndB with AHSA1/START domain